jgi:hypothetical protein
MSRNDNFSNYLNQMYLSVFVGFAIDAVLQRTAPTPIKCRKPITQNTPSVVEIGWPYACTVVADTPSVVTSLLLRCPLAFASDRGVADLVNRPRYGLRSVPCAPS